MSAANEIKLIQRIINAEGRFKLKVDGVYGKLTARGHLKSSPAVRRILDTFYREANLYKRNTPTINVGSVSSPVSSVKIEPGYSYENINQRFIDSERMSVIIRQVSKMTGVPLSYLRMTIGIEPFFKVVGGVTHYNVWSHDGDSSYRGLFQMSTAAWEDATKHLLKKRIRLTGYKSGVYIAYSNALAAAGFYLANLHYHAHKHNGRYSRLPISDQVMYGMHVNGWSFLKHQRVDGRQSDLARNVMADAVKQLKA